MLNTSTLVVFLIAISIYSVHSNQNEVGSGDDDINDNENEVPYAKWDKPNYPSTGYNGGNERIIHGSDNSWKPENAWNRKPPGEDNEWEIDDAEEGCGDDQERGEIIPGQQEPRPIQPSDRDDEIGGGGINMNPNNPYDAQEPCPTDDYCKNNGICYVDSATKKAFCVCTQDFAGEQCERKITGFLVDEDEDDDNGGKPSPVEQKSLLVEIFTHPITIAVMGVCGLLCIGLIITLLICCCRCIRKKDEGSYTLDAALHNPKVEYTKVPNGQEFYA